MQCDETAEDISPDGLHKKHRRFGTKMEYVVVIFGNRWFKPLNFQFHSDSFIQRCPEKIS